VIRNEFPRRGRTKGGEDQQTKLIYPGEGATSSTETAVGKKNDQEGAKETQEAEQGGGLGLLSSQKSGAKKHAKHKRRVNNGKKQKQKVV